MSFYVLAVLISLAGRSTDAASCGSRALSKPMDPSCPVKVGFDAKCGLMLTASSCAVLQDEIDALSKWKVRLGEGASSSTPIFVQNSSTKSCSVSLDEYLPEFVRKHGGKHPKHDGPNCSNAALVVSKVTTGLMLMNGEVDFWLSSPLCRELAPSEIPQPGDIVADQGGLHHYVYISPNLRFEKTSAYKDSPYEIRVQTCPEEGICDPSVADQTKCIIFVCDYNTDPRHNKECSYRLKYYRCLPKPSAKLMSPSTQRLREEAERLTCILERELMGETQPLSKDEMDLLRRSTLALQITIKAERPTSKGGEAFIWEGLLLRTQTILDQIESLNSERKKDSQK